MENLGMMLVVDDIKANRAILKNIFKSEYTVIEASGAEQALDLMRSIPSLKVVLLDLMMPGGNGFSVLREMQEEEALSLLPVLVTTICDEEENELKAMRLGAADFIPKPFQPQVVRQRVENAMSKWRFEALCLQVERDALTLIYNRETFYKKTQNMLAENEDKQYMLVYWDIDRFKILNDIFGVEIGDCVLRSIACEIGEMLHGKGTYGRLNSDRFAVCCEQPIFGVAVMQERLSRALKPLRLHYDVVLLAGVYPIDDRTLSVEKMCERANIALDTVKGKTIRRIGIYDVALRERLLEEQRTTGEMSVALQEAQFEVYLQSVYSATANAPVSAEALVRWNHPTRGCLLPAAFLPLMERNGFVLQLDAYVWDRVCKFQSECLAQKKPMVPISVNVSRMDFFYTNLVTHWRILLEKYNLDSQWIRLEISESTYSQNSQQLIQTTKALQQLGLQIWMDNFGSSHSSLNSLKDVAVDVLKIDIRFIKELETSHRAGSVLSSVVRMARWLEMSVVAQGVETKTQSDFLRSIGCDCMQGYYYAMPLHKAAFLALLEKRPPAQLPEESFVAQDVDLERIVSADKNVAMLFNHMIGGAALYEQYGDTIEIMRVNDGYYEMTGASADTLYKDTKNALAWGYPEDRHLFLEACSRLQKKTGIEQLELRRYRQDGTLMWMKMKLRFLGTRGNHMLLLGVINDITEQKMLEEKYQILLQQTNHIHSAEKQQVEASCDGAPCEKAGRGCPPPCLLIVDDNELNRNMLQQMLAEKYCLAFAENGKDALCYLQKKPDDVQLILLDKEMPIMNSSAFLKNRKTAVALQKIPVLLCAHQITRDEVLQAYALGADDVAHKPYDPEMLCCKVENLLRRCALSKGNNEPPLKRGKQPL